MENKKILYENLLNQHRIVSNQISDIRLEILNQHKKIKKKLNY